MSVFEEMESGRMVSVCHINGMTGAKTYSCDFIRRTTKQHIVLSGNLYFSRKTGRESACAGAPERGYSFIEAPLAPASASLLNHLPSDSHAIQ